MGWVSKLRKCWRRSRDWTKRLDLEKKQERARLKERYPAEMLEADADSRQSRIEASVRADYAEKISGYKSVISEIESVLPDKKDKFEILSTDFRAEIAACFEHLENIKRQQKVVKEDLSDAYQRLEDAKDEVNAWHSKANRSQFFFGNSGKKIPKHSMFGQSFGDLDAAKARRSEAGDAVGELKTERSRLSSDYQSTRSRIAELKTKRQRMRQLRGEGYRREVLKSEIDVLERQIDRAKLKIKAAKRRQENIIRRQVEEAGILEQRSRASAMRKERDQLFAASFSKENRERMKAEFVAEWEKNEASQAS